MAKILLVDDSQPVRTMIRTCVLMGVPGEHTVMEAGSAAEGLDCWKRQAPDIVVTELSFCEGRMSGHDLIGCIRLVDPDASIIVVASMDGVDEQPDVCGANRVFSKPFNINEFIEAVRRLLLTVSAA